MQNINTGSGLVKRKVKKLKTAADGYFFGYAHIGGDLVKVKKSVGRGCKTWVLA